MSVDPAALLLKLVFTVLIPTVVGKLARDFLRVKRTGWTLRSWVDRHKLKLSMFSTLQLALIVWQTLSGARDTLFAQSPGSVFAVIALALAMHLLYLAFNAVMVCKYVLRLPPREAVAVLIMSSQKSAPVAVAVITYITNSSTAQGLLALPCIIGQLLQIFVGSPVARYLRTFVDRHEREERAR